VPLEYLVEKFRELVNFKGKHDIEAHIDTVGDPLTYPELVELVAQLHQIKGVKTVSLQTHGSLLNERLLDELSEAGLTRINLSIDSLDSETAKKLANTKWYNVKKVADLAKYTVENTSISLLIAPVWVPTINDEEIPKIIRFARETIKEKEFPLIGIQKYEVHKYGRKADGVKAISWKRFYDQLRTWEKLYEVKLVLKPEDFGIHKRQMLPISYKRLEKVKVRVVGPGWLKGEKLAVTLRGDRAVTLVRAREIPLGAKVKARVLSNKHNIYVAEPAF